MARIFISYSRADRQFVDELVPLLRELYGQDCLFFDDQIPGGANWWSLILAEITSCDLFLYLCSNESLSSTYCQNEFREAFRLHKHLLPIIVRPKTAYPGNIPEDIADILRITQYIDLSLGFRDRDQSQKLTVRLFRAINLLLESEPDQPAQHLTAFREPKLNTDDQRPSVKIRRTLFWFVAFGLLLALLIIAMSLANNPISDRSPQETISIDPVNTKSPLPQPTNTSITDTTIPESATSSIVTPIGGLSTGSPDCMYTVQSGDNLYRIALIHGLTLQELRNANLQISGDLIQLGDRLNIPNCATDPNSFVNSSESPTSFPSATASHTSSATPTPRPITPTATMPSSNLAQATVKVSSANLRYGPGTNYGVADTATQGELLRVIARTDDNQWFLVEFDNKALWVSATVVEVSVSNTSIQVAATIPASPHLDPATADVNTAYSIADDQSLALDQSPVIVSGSISKSQSVNYTLVNNSGYRAISLDMQSDGISDGCAVLFSSDTLFDPINNYQFSQAVVARVVRRVHIPNGQTILKVGYLDYGTSSCPDILNFTLTIWG